MPLTIANRITVLRILFIPLFILLILYFNESVVHGRPDVSLRWFATVVFLGIFILDAVDGYVARVRKEISKLGTLLDPLADKAMLLSALIVLQLSSSAFQPALPTWFVLMVISRDVLLVGGALIIQSITGNLTVRPRISGKITTFFQMSVIIWVLIGLHKQIFIALLGVTAALTFVSAVQYILDGVRQLDKAR